MEARRITTQLMTQFQEELHNEEKSSNTIEKYTRDVGAFAKFAQGQEITKALVVAYKTCLGEEYALTSANSMIAAINHFFKFSGWPELCVRQFKAQRNSYCSEEKELTKREYLALVKGAEGQKNKRLSLLLQTICATGIRVSELMYITVEAAKQGEAMVCCKGKTRKIFIVSKLGKRLLRYAKANGITRGAIFITRNGRPLNRSNIWREMKRLCEWVGVTPNKVFPHNLRHLFARTFYQLEKDIVKLADILGHESMNTTRVYMISSGIEHRRKLEQMYLIL